jgi:hypothetical protein
MEDGTMIETDEQLQQARNSWGNAVQFFAQSWLTYPIRFRRRKEQYYQQNKEKILQRNKMRVFCDCFCNVSRGNFARHKKSIKHGDMIVLKPVRDFLIGRLNEDVVSVISEFIV